MRQLETDIVVVAAGTAGLSAIVAAAQKGVRVIAFEKAAATGGAGNMAMGPFAVESMLQRLRKVNLHRDEAFKIFMEFNHWRADARLIRAYIDKSGDTINWLEKLGVEFSDVQAHNEGFYFTWHIIKGPDFPRETPASASAMMKILTQKAQEMGAQIFTKTPVKKLLKKGSEIAGVIAEDSSGEEIQVKARAVIIATGGFGDNPEWIKKYTGYEWGKDLFSIRIPGVTGDGIRMAWEAGAAPTEMRISQVTCIPDIPQFVNVDHAFRQPNLMVNLFGERIMNEEILQRTPFGVNPIASQKNHVAFMVFDESIKNHYQEVGLDFPPGNLVATPLVTVNDFDIEFKQILAEGIKNSVFKADSLDELAEQTGIRAEGLKKTIEDYNVACETGRDHIFNKSQKLLRPIMSPLFYAARVTVSGLGTLGGIKINHKTEVIGKNFEVVPGLYAAGLDANTIYGDTYLFTLPGNTFGFAVNSGRMAGEYAAEYVKSK